MDFAAVIVLHESRAELARLLRSLQGTSGAPSQLVVVDTGDDDGGAALAAAHGADVILLRDNPGYGAANNAGFERVSADVTILLNPDIRVRDDALARLAARARTHPAALHAPLLLNADGSRQRSAHPVPGTVGGLLPALTHPPLLPRPLRDRVEPYRSQRTRTVGWAITACLAAPTETLRALGPFDPAIHLFAGDMELCLRARGSGIRTVLHSDLALVHDGGHSLMRSGEQFEALARGRRSVVRATRGPLAQTLDDAAQAMTFATRIAARAALGRSWQRELLQLKALF